MGPGGIGRFPRGHGLGNEQKGEAAGTSGELTAASRGNTGVDLKAAAGGCRFDSLSLTYNQSRQNRNPLRGLRGGRHSSARAIHAAERRTLGELGATAPRLAIDPILPKMTAWKRWSTSPRSRSSARIAYA